LWWSWYKPELPHQAQSVCDAPVFDDPAMLKAADINDGDGKRLAGRGAPHERPLMGAARGNPRPRLIATGDHLFNGQVQVREGSAQADNCSLDSFEIRGHETILVFQEVRGKEFIQGSQIPFVEAFVNDPVTLTAKVHEGLHAAGMAADAWGPPLLQLLGLEPGAAELAALSAKAHRTRIFDALLHLILHTSRQGALVLEIENLHWMDPTSEE
jgi:hypothetical protein